MQDRIKHAADAFFDATPSPGDVVPVLRAIADRMRESQADLQSAWQDRNAGKEWGKIARQLEGLANRLVQIIGD